MTAKDTMTSENLDELLKKASEMLARKPGKEKPVVAVWGMMNAGKSYLLNMLTHHYNVEYFPTNDIRETAELRSFEGEQYVFLDTPGLDANESDDKVALDGVAMADIVLFVHQPQGELEKIELDFLKQLKSSFGDHADKSIVMVISKADSETKDKIDQIQRRVLEQCLSLLDFSPASFQISGARFHKGVKQHKDGMVKASHLEELKEHLDNLVIDVVKVRQERELQAVYLLLEEITSFEENLNDKKQQLQDELSQNLSYFNSTMLSLDLSMTMKRTEYMSAKLQGE